MTKQLLLVGIFVVTSFVTFSQTNKVESIQKNDLKSESIQLDSVKVFNDKTVVPSSDQGTYPQKHSVGTKPNNANLTKSSQQPHVRTIDDINTEIESIQNKKDYLDNNPVLKDAAVADGTYAEMEDRLVYLLAEKDKHLNK